MKLLRPLEGAFAFLFGGIMAVHVITLFLKQNDCSVAIKKRAVKLTGATTAGPASS